MLGLATGLGDADGDADGATDGASDGATLGAGGTQFGCCPAMISSSETGSLTWRPDWEQLAVATSLGW